MAIAAVGVRTRVRSSRLRRQRQHHDRALNQEVNRKPQVVSWPTADDASSGATVEERFAKPASSWCCRWRLQQSAGAQECAAADCVGSASTAVERSIKRSTALPTTPELNPPHSRHGRARSGTSVACAAGAMGALFSRVAGESTAPEGGTEFVSELESIPCSTTTPGTSRAHPSAGHKPSASARPTAQHPSVGSRARGC